MQNETTTSNKRIGGRTRLIGVNEKMSGKSISQGDEFFSGHLSTFMNSITKEEIKEEFKSKISQSLGEEISLREANIKKKINEKISKSRTTGNTQTSPRKGREQGGIEEEDLAKKMEEFSKKFKESREIDSLLNQSLSVAPALSLGQVEYTIEKEEKAIETKTFKPTTPKKGFSTKLLTFFSSDIIQKYVYDFVQNLSIWLKNDDYEKLPIVYPYNIRIKSGEKGEEKKKKKRLEIDKRGFKLVGNPMGSVIYGKHVKGGIYEPNTKINPKGNVGFVQCHIWPDTTRAPPLFTFIPNLVWLPRIVHYLTDDPLAKRSNNILPSILKQVSRDYYPINDKQNEGLAIISTICQNELKFESKKENEINSTKIPNIILGKVQTKEKIENLTAYIGKFREEGAKPPKGKTEGNFSLNYLKALYAKIQKDKKEEKDLLADLESWLFVYKNSIKEKGLKWLSGFGRTEQEKKKEGEKREREEPEEGKKIGGENGKKGESRKGKKKETKETIYLKDFVYHLCNRTGESTKEAKAFREIIEEEKRIDKIREERLLNWMDLCAKDYISHKKEQELSFKNLEKCVEKKYEKEEDFEKYKQKFLPLFEEFRKSSQYSQYIK